MRVFNRGTIVGRLPLLGAFIVSMAVMGEVHADEVYFGAPGGSTEKGYVNGISTQFKAATGIDVIYDAGATAATLAKLRSQAGSPSLDVVHLASSGFSQAIDEGLLGTFDTTHIPNLANITDRVGRSKYAVPIGISAIGILYNKDVFAEKGWAPPTSWYDIWDPKYHGRLGFYTASTTATAGLIAAVASDFGKREMVSGVDEAFDQFKALKPSVATFFSTGGQFDTAMLQGNIWIGVNVTVRGAALASEGFPVGVAPTEEGLIGYETWLGFVNNRPNPEAAYKFADFILSEEGQLGMARNVGYGPVLTSVAVPEEMQEFVPDIDDVFFPDWLAISAQWGDWIDRWNREIER